MNKKELKVAMRNIIKNYEHYQKGISKVLLFGLLEGDIKDKHLCLKELLEDGEIYESMKNQYRWVE